MQQLQQWITHAQPTVRVPFERDKDGMMRFISDRQAKQARVWKRVEAPRSDAATAEAGVRSGLILQACPYLEHLSIFADSARHVGVLHEDTFALVPRLRLVTLN